MQVDKEMQQEEELAMRGKRHGLVVWLHNLKSVRHLRKYGNVHYVSRRMRYASIYVDAETVDASIERLQRLKYVRKVERSFRHLIPTKFEKVQPDKAKEYDYKMDTANLKRSLGLGE